MRVLVCGGRNYRDRNRVFNALDKLNLTRGITCVIHGAASGADMLARDWAVSRKVEHKPFPANWRQHGKAAGPIRNQAMLIYGMPDGVVAFPGGKGTKDMVERAAAGGVVVWRPYGK